MYKRQGFDHKHDFEVALPGLLEVLEANPNIKFDIFGKIPKPPAMDALEDRVTVYSVVNNYQEFMKVLVSLDWDIGICPLADTEFNKVKNVNKWVEYTSAGIVTVASNGLIYDDCCRGNCGVLVDRAGWSEALSGLIKNPTKIKTIVEAAQGKVSEKFSPSQQEAEILELINV